jgi:hypothetical protein
VVLYAVNSESLIVAVREPELPHAVDAPLRQLATYSFDATDVVSYGDDSFEECCNGSRRFWSVQISCCPASWPCVRPNCGRSDHECS